jgi:tetratricopeptide (TPR) repeat protein
MSSSAAEALALLRAGRSAEAESMLRAAVAGGAADAEVVHLLGFLLATSGRAPEGLPLIDRSLAQMPANVGFLDNRAQILMQMGLLDEARRDAEAATTIEPRFMQGWLHLAQITRRQGRARDSLAAVNRALALDPHHPAATYHVALLAFEAGQLDAAEAGFMRVLEREPRHAGALSNLGIVQRETGRTEAALDSFTRAAAYEPANAHAQMNLGLALQQAGRNPEAFSAFVRAGFPEALANAAGIAMEMESLEEARALYARSAELRPGFADAEYGLAQIALREHRFAEGWDGYERRFDTHPPLATPRAPPMPRLGPDDLARAKRVALWSEQGLGDQILFTTLLPELERRGIRAVVEVDARLLGLYRRALPFFEFTAREEAAHAFAGCDYHLPLGSLPRLFRRSVESFAAQPTALLSRAVAPAQAGAQSPSGAVAPAQASAQSPSGADAPAQASAQSPSGAGARLIAISWRSLQTGVRRGLAERKSLPLESFAELARATGARLLDLQYGEVDEERRAFDARHPGVLVRVEGLDARNDLEGVAAQLLRCERFVTASNATAHLAGALGVETRLIAPRGWAPFSYWVPGPGGRALWYPSVTVSPKLLDEELP